MDNSSITTNTTNTTCSGSLQLSSDNFTSCVQMAATPSSSYSGRTYTLDPLNKLSSGENYKLKILIS